MLARSEDMKIIEAFRQIDADGSGKIDRNEMFSFLLSKGIDESHATQILDVVFKACDTDASGLIDLEEFTQNYIQTKNKLLDRQMELED